MYTEDLHFTPLNQIIDLDTQARLDNNNKSFAGYNWGNDRVVTLRHRDTPVKRQWNGTCTSFSVVAAIENLLENKYHLSERSLWDYYGKFSTKDALRAASGNYILDEEDWPQDQVRIPTEYEKNGRYRIEKLTYLEDDYPKVISAIDNGFPLVVAMSTPKDLKRGMAQIERTSKISRRGGHAMCVSGYKVENGKCYFLVKNSWGTRIGDQGYQYIDFELFTIKRKRYATFWSIEAIEIREPQDIKAFTPDALNAIWDFD